MTPRPQRGGRLTRPGRPATKPQPAWDAEAIRSPLTDRERAAILALRRLEANWPQTLTLVSMSGVLHVIRTCDERFLNREERADCVHAMVYGIPNKGVDL